MCKKNVIFCGGIEYGIFVATEVANAIDSLSLESWGSQLISTEFWGRKKKNHLNHVTVNPVQRQVLFI
jgi:hypothetical protein